MARAGGSGRREDEPIPPPRWRAGRPAEPLRRFVDGYWFMDDYRPQHDRELSLPDGSSEWVVSLASDDIRLFDRNGRALLLEGAILCGPHSDYFVIDTSGPSRAVGVHFKPGGLRPFVREPMDGLTNGHFGLRPAFGAALSHLREQLLEAREPEAMFAVLDRTLLSLMDDRAAAPHPAVLVVMDAMRRRPFREAVESAVLSRRRIDALFKAQLGLTPAMLHRLSRFQQALAGLDGGREPDWAGLAAECGYYDQAHFNHDFRAFSGIRPGDYRRSAGRHRNHAGIDG